MATESLHQGLVFLGFACLLSELDKPFAERLVESTLLCTGELTGLFNKFFVGTERDVLHTRAVYTISVYTATGLLLRKGRAPGKLRSCT